MDNLDVHGIDSLCDSALLEVNNLISQLDRTGCSRYSRKLERLFEHVQAIKSSVNEAKEMTISDKQSGVKQDVKLTKKQEFFICLLVENFYNYWVKDSLYRSVVHIHDDDFDLDTYYEAISALAFLHGAVAGVNCVSFLNWEKRAIRILNNKGNIIIEKSPEICTYNIEELASYFKGGKHLKGYADYTILLDACLYHEIDKYCPISDDNCNGECYVCDNSKGDRKYDWDNDTWILNKEACAANTGKLFGL